MSVKNTLRKYSRQLRHNQTQAENHLWYFLRANRFQALKFKRQKVIGNYIVDFYCAKCKLIIEIDGDEHFTAEHKIYDDERSKILSLSGFKVIRYTNREIIHETKRVLDDILMEIENYSLGTSPAVSAMRLHGGTP